MLELTTAAGPPAACEVTLTVSEGGSPDAMCSADVSLVDAVDPTATCANITVQLDASGAASIVPADVDGGSVDSCSDVTLSVNTSDFDCDDVGPAVEVTLTVEDVSLNSDSCSAFVTVEDNVDPTAMCQSISVQLNGTGNASITAGDVDGGSSDACGIASLAVSPDSFSCADVGVQTVTLIVVDNNGNDSTCEATVTVGDTEKPVVQCKTVSVLLNPDGMATITAADVDDGSTDNCGIDSMSVSPDTFDCSDVPSAMVTLTVTDVNGNSATCMTTVTVTDSEDPMASCQSTTVNLDASGNGSITAADVDNGSSDNCGVASLLVSPSAFTCSDLPNTMVTLTVTDTSGNTGKCDVPVTVLDTVKPTAICRDFPVQLDSSGNASITAAQVDNGSSDNCGIASLEI
jgi:hypothetical protein